MIKSLAKKIKRNVVANMSEVAEVTPDDALEVAQAKEKGKIKAIYNFLGENPAEIIKEPEVRKIKNGKDTYFTADSISSVSLKRFFGDPRMIDPALVDATIRNFTVLHGDNEVASIQVWQNNVVEEGEGNVPPFEIKMHGNDGQKVVETSAPIDINDINSIRYAVKDNDQAAYFFDKYFIVSDADKDRYAAFDKEQRDIQKAKLEAIKKAHRQENKVQKETQKNHEAEAKAEQKKNLAIQKAQAEYRNRFFGD